MDLTRRQFNTAAAFVSLTVFGCDSHAEQSATPRDDQDEEKRKNKARLATEPFIVGPITKYRGRGVYEQYKPEKGVWLVSDGKQLIAFSASCTHIDCTTHWLADRGMFECPCHKSRFGTNGRQQEGSKAKRPLERCAIRQVNTGSGPQLEVDPTRRFREDKGEWSDPASFMPLN